MLAKCGGNIDGLIRVMYEMESPDDVNVMRYEVIDVVQKIQDDEH